MPYARRKPAMSSDLLTRIKGLPISEVLGHYISLKNKGQDYIALCPFHNDSKPSLHVSEKKGLFKCFACGEGGDAIAFVEKFKNIPFKEAITDIAQKCNLPMDDFRSRKMANPKYAMGLRLNKAALKIFRKCAQSLKRPEFNQFVADRNLSQEIVTQFALGYAPDDNALTHYFSTLPESEREKALARAQEIGLIRLSQKREGEFYDTFRERIIFPIWDQYDKLLGFGSRATRNYQKGKYINSQESFLFNKKDLLYGLNFAKSSIRDKAQVIVVEGYMDCLSLVKNGLSQTVAVMGVAMAPHMARILSKMASDIVLGFDSDDAGFKAAKRVNQLFLKEGLLPRYLNYTPYKDPDEFLQNQSRIELMERIEKAPTLLDLLIDQVLETIPQNTDHKLAKLQIIFELVGPLKKTLPATERIIEGAKRLGLKSTHEQILDSYAQYLANEKTPAPRPTPLSEASETSEQKKRQGPPLAANDGPLLSKSDCIILKNTAAHPGCFQSPNCQELLEYVSCDEVKQILELLKNVYFEVNEGHYSKMALATLRGEGVGSSVMKVVTEGFLHYTSHDELDEERREKLIRDLHKKFKEIRLVEQRMQLEERRQVCATDQESLEYLKKINTIQQELNELKR